MYQAGIRNLAATSGTAFTPEHATLLQRFTSHIVLVFDGDSAGQTAASRAVFMLAPFNLDVSILVLPADEDPDSFVRKSGKDVFLQLVKGAQSWIDFIIERMILEHDTGTGRGKSAVIAALKPLIQSIRDSIVQQRFKKELSERLGVAEGVVYSRMHTAEQRNSGYGSGLTSDEVYLGTLEGSFLRILMTKPEFISEARQYVVPETLTDGVSGDIYSLLLESFEQGSDVSGLVYRTNDLEIKRLISLLLVKPALQDHIHEELVQKIIYLRAKFLKTRIRSIKLQMKNEPHQRNELLKSLQDYSMQLQELDGVE